MDGKPSRLRPTRQSACGEGQADVATTPRTKMMMLAMLAQQRRRRRLSHTHQYQRSRAAITTRRTELKKQAKHRKDGLVKTERTMDKDGRADATIRL